MPPKKIYLNYVNEDDEKKTWCEDPVYVEDCEMQNREYIDLSQVWHPAEEEAEKDRLLFVEDIDHFFTDCMRYDEDEDWAEFIHIIGIIRWAYVADLLPKGGKQ